MSMTRRADLERTRRISEELKEVSDELIAADSDFNEAVDPDLIESLIYLRCSLRAKYSFLIKQLRSSK